MLKLPARFVDQLLDSPESGMGYQFVEAVTVGWGVDARQAKSAREIKLLRGTVYNAELLMFEGEPRSKLIIHGFTGVLSEAKITEEEIVSLWVSALPSPSSSLALHEASASYGTKAAPAKDASPEQTRDNEVFKRFSVYKNDRRIRTDGSLLPGSYATTEADACNVRTGREAVARYALPNPDPASYVFTITPHRDTVIQRGIVEPANNQPGGGAEVIFTRGTQPRTVTGPVPIPD